MERYPEQDHTQQEGEKKEKQDSGLKWLLIGGCITVLVALCIVCGFGFVVMQTQGIIAQSNASTPASQNNTLAPITFEVTNTPLSTEDFLNSATATFDPTAPTITAPPFPTSPPTSLPGVGIPVPEMGFEYGAVSLHASNPKNFVAAAGQPQLVELFAFW